jgi:hypothetical protein
MAYDLSVPRQFLTKRTFFCNGLNSTSN